MQPRKIAGLMGHSLLTHRRHNGFQEEADQKELQITALWMRWHWVVPASAEGAFIAVTPRTRPRGSRTLITAVPTRALKPLSLLAEAVMLEVVIWLNLLLGGCGGWLASPPGIYLSFGPVIGDSISIGVKDRFDWGFPGQSVVRCPIQLQSPALRGDHSKSQQSCWSRIGI